MYKDTARTRCLAEVNGVNSTFPYCVVVKTKNTGYIPRADPRLNGLDVVQAVFRQQPDCSPRSSSATSLVVLSRRDGNPRCLLNHHVIMPLQQLHIVLVRLLSTATHIVCLDM